MIKYKWSRIIIFFLKKRNYTTFWISHTFGLKQTLGPFQLFNNFHYASLHVFLRLTEQDYWAHEYNFDFITQLAAINKPLSSSCNHRSHFPKDSFPV